MLAQLRTGMVRLNGYLYRIKVADGSVWMWISKRDSGTIPLSMSEVDHPPDGNAAIYSYSPKQYILFLRW